MAASPVRQARVNKTQSAVSMQMRRLEERLNRVLFEKDGRVNRLTGDGEKLLAYARRMVRLNNETLAAFDEEALAGSVRLGTPDDYADRYMPDIIARFAKSNPNVELSIDCEPSRDLVDKLSRNEIDIALVTHSPKVWQSQVVRTEPLLWVNLTGAFRSYRNSPAAGRRPTQLRLASAWLLGSRFRRPLLFDPVQQLVIDGRGLGRACRARRFTAA